MGKRSYQYMRGRAVVVSGRHLGEVRWRVYYRQVYGSKHFLKHPPGIAYLVESLDIAAEMGARECIVVDRETEITYRAALSEVKRLGVAFDRGYGAQLCLPFDYWTVERAPETTGKPKAGGGSAAVWGGRS